MKPIIMPGWITIPAGSYTLGTGPARIDWLKAHTTWATEFEADGFFALEPPRQVSLSAFRIAQTPVTVREYRRFVEADGYGERRWWSEAGWSWRTAGGHIAPRYWAEPQWAGADLLPVVGVSWHEASAYCHWLSEHLGETVRLPQEDEWEAAARGTDGRIYPWGDDYRRGYANINETYHALGQRYLATTSPVDRHLPGASPFGLLDTCGNVWEWCATPYDGPDDERRVTRGGSWHNAASVARTAYRSYGFPPDQRNNLGFRLAADA